MIRPPSYSFTGDCLFDYIHEQRKEGHFLWARVAGLATSLFAALDVFHHLGQALYKTGHILLTKASRFTFADVRTHLTQAVWFALFTAIGSPVAVITPEEGINHLCRKAILNRVAKESETFGHIQFALKQDRILVREAVEKNGLVLAHVPEAFQNDRDMVHKALSSTPHPVLQYASVDLRKNLQLCIKACTQNLKNLSFADPAILNHFASVREILATNGLALEYVPQELLRSHPELVDAAIAQNGLALQFAPPTSRNDRELVILATSKCEAALRYASDTLKDDPVICKAIVNQNGRALQYVSERLRNDREVALIAVKQDGTALNYVSTQLRSDPEVILAAVNNRASALLSVDEELPCYREVTLLAVRRRGLLLEYAPALSNDREVVLAAVGQNGLALRYTSTALQRDKETVLAAVRQNKKALQFADIALWRDPEIVQEVERHNQEKTP